jgi:hypothetical protein
MLDSQQLSCTKLPDLEFVPFRGAQHKKQQERHGIDEAEFRSLPHWQIVHIL